MARKAPVSQNEPSDNNQNPGDAQAPGATGTAGTPAAAPGHGQPPAGDAPKPEGAVTPAAAAPDPFDPAALRLSQDFAASLGVKQALLSMPVRKPDKAWWVRVHPDESYHLQTAVVVLKADRGEETYLVAPALWPALATEPTFSPRALYAAVNRQGTHFLWMVKLPGPDGRMDEWSRTALEAVNLATKGWVRVAANMNLGAYDVFQATGELGEPQWRPEPFRELLR